VSGEPAGLAVLVRTDTTFEANAIVVVLEDAGIQSLVVAPEAILPGLSVGRDGRRITVQVREDDLDKAQRALEEAREDAPVDWSRVDIGEVTDPADEQTSPDPAPAPGMPLLARAGLFVAVAAILLGTVLFLVMLFV
jgi:hypothetical protein